MLQNLHNSEFYKTMDLFNEIDEFNDLLLLEKNSKLDSEVEGYEDLQSKYSSLHENYAKEIENSKKVEKCLIKCLKYYSKLCKKYEVQQKIIMGLKESIKEKISSLEEAQRNEVKLKGLIQVYKTERILYAGETSAQLRTDKELLLDICCKLIGDSVKSNSTRSFANLLLRKFKSDLDEEKLSLLKRKSVKLKDELDFGSDLKPDLKEFKNEIEFKSEDQYNSEMTKLEVQEQEEDTKNNPLDLSKSRVIEEGSNCPDDNNLSSKVIEEESNATDDSDLSSKVIEEESNATGGNDLSNKVIEEESNSRNDNNLSSKVIEEVSNCTDDDGLSQGCESKVEEQENLFELGNCSDNLGEKEEKLEGHSSVNNPIRINIDAADSEEESTFPYEKELSIIFREMASVRMLSPLRENNNSPVDDGACAVAQNTKESHTCANSEPVHKRNLDVEENPCKSKRLKPEEERPSGSLLDSILSAMSLQTEEFKSKGYQQKESESCANSPPRFRSLGTRTYSRVRKSGNFSSKENSISCLNPGSSNEKPQTVEKIVAEEIKNFVSAPMSSKEDADKNVKHCISVLSNKSEDLIAKSIVAMVLENVDEVVEIFERPAPPLTKTQHRLIVLLSVFQNLEPKSEISTKILSIIWEKLFPDNFFWPDDSVEAATRFYSALCRARNDPKTLWRFCLHAMTEMRQRCPLLMFTVLKTWPDVLHDASTLRNNLLAVTIVNIFLHMSKTEGLRNFNQGRKLIALKHLLMNYYQFKVEDTIEGYATKVLDAVCRSELGSEKSLVLLAKCRDESWTTKNVFPGLKSRLTDWFEGKLEDPIANRILSVMKQICPVLLQDTTNKAKVKEIVSCLSDVLTSGKKSHDSEINVIQVLLQLKQYPEARKVIREWIPKSPIDESLRNEIIDASAENILRELRLNRKKDSRSFALKKKLQKQSKKSKGKKKKGKKRKMSASPKARKQSAGSAVVSS